ncbi:hypothetical protein KW849_26670 [Pseudomonas sp. PDM26]|uniref:hypothetical protein n=1 Tax=Pseudomonas sp. PDM26 TaxID=2854766 RepID=UPI001C48395A|nr:hypothetical protein [Pseudomonas sp. PDM26]MBV7549870.1 hypothetical protein [Pseudomonas sp. PDM26]
MYSALNEIFEKLDNLVDNRDLKYSSIPRFASAFYGAPVVVEGELIPELIRLSSEPFFRVDIYALFIEGVKEAFRQNEELLAEDPNDKATKLRYSLTLQQLQPKLTITEFEGMVSFYAAELVRYPGSVDIYGNVYANINGVSGADFVERTYPWYWIGHILYARRRSELKRIEFLEQVVSKQVVQEYAMIDIDLTATDPQFSKYRILSLSPHHQIQNDKDSQTIVDERLQKHFWLNVPRRLLFALEDLREKGYYTKIAFNIKAVTDFVLMMEEMERGAKLKINVADMPDISKFYSTEAYDDNLWVVHDREKNSLTFEEHRRDFEGVGDKVVTQVVHLEYKIEGGKTLITHLDHEFIVYTLDEYLLRLEDSAVKGSVGKVKSFKIDGAEIPFDFKYDDDWFLLIVLDAYFLNHKLIQEVFEDIVRG